VTNGPKSVFIFNAGTLQSGNTTVSNGSVFTIGDGVSHRENRPTTNGAVLEGATWSSMPGAPSALAACGRAGH
jgi:hypothetical protein